METIEYKGFKINIEQDSDTINPREEWDNLGTMVCFHGRYTLGDKHNMSIDEAQKLRASKDIISLPLYLYDHSGITINTTGFSCPWDSGQVGFIYVTKEKIRKEYGWKVITKKREETVKGYLLGEVETYDQYLTGDVYGFSIEGLEDSCWGFFGSDHEKSGLLEHARPVIDYEVKKQEALKEAKDLPFEKIPVEYNKAEFSEVKDLYKKRLEEDPAKYGIQVSLAL